MGSEMCIRDRYIAQATRPGYSAPLYRAYRAVAGGTSEQGVQEPPDPFALVTARVEEELKSPLQNMLGVRPSTFLHFLMFLALITFHFAGRLDATALDSDASDES